jgi:ketosteroid isomerase-like protein
VDDHVGAAPAPGLLGWGHNHSFRWTRCNSRTMSQENVEKTRAFIEAYNRRDFDTATKDFHPRIDWILPAAMGYDSCIGVERVISFFKGLDETWDDLQLRPQEYVDAGDRVAVRLRHYGVAMSTGIELDEELYHQVTTFDDGTIVRMEYFETWEAAREAAGVAD